MQNVFHNKNFVLVFLGALVSNIGSLFYSFSVGYWILDITNNNAIIQGIYLGVCGLTFVLFSLFFIFTHQKALGNVLCRRELVSFIFAV